MAKTPINEVLADNLAYFMSVKNFTQASLGRKVQLAQRTIGNYMNPALRAAGKSGKAPSAKISELERIAEGLGVETWELLRPLSPAEREFYKQIEESFEKLRNIAPALNNPERKPETSASS